MSTRSSVILSVCNSTTPTGRISVKFRICGFYCNFSIHPEFDGNQAEITIYTKTYKYVRYLAVVFINETAMSWGRRNSWRSEHNNQGWLIVNLPVYNISTKDTIFHYLRHINYDRLQTYYQYTVKSYNVWRVKTLKGAFIIIKFSVLFLKLFMNY